MFSNFLTIFKNLKEESSFSDPLTNTFFSSRLGSSWSLSDWLLTLLPSESPKALGFYLHLSMNIVSPIQLFRLSQITTPSVRMSSLL